MSESDFTYRLSALNNFFMSEAETVSARYFATLHTRQDFDELLDEWETFRDSSRVPALRAEIFRMFKDVGIPCDKFFSIDDCRRAVRDADLPDRSDFDELIIRLIFQNYTAFPAPGDFMRRIVDKFSCDEWRKDTLRLRILK